MAVTMVVGNDTRGWILTSLSAIACVFGALGTCIDLLVRLFPGKKNFRIEDSDAFLSSSLSLSAGVMLFSALYSMLPSSHSYLESGGFSSKAAGWILLGCFLGGVFGIQVLSRIFHMFMPHTVEECDHTHAEQGNGNANSHNNEHSSLGRHNHHDGQQSMSEITPLLHYQNTASHDPGDTTPNSTHFGAEAGINQGRPSLQTRMTTTVSRIVSMTKPTCDAEGPCLGYSDPCGQECYKVTGTRPGKTGTWRSAKLGEFRRLKSMPAKQSGFDLDDEAGPTSRQSLSGTSSEFDISKAPQRANDQTGDSSVRSASCNSNSKDTNGAGFVRQSVELEAPESQQNHHHHHHVPKNAFLSISLQTSVAIALHKLPEGFITYATNHANPKLGFSVFVALFIHNISEGFALALPIYLASRSRVKCLVISAILGGLSQPLGAGIAAVWLKLAERGRGDYAPSEKVYGGMFAVTAGIMASVGLSLLQESLEMTHNKRLCMVFAFIGMGVLGASTALTA